MHHQELAAVGHGMHRLVADFDSAESQAEELAQEFVVVTGDVGDFRALARLAQDLLHHVVVGLGPVPAALQLPAIDDVADQVEVIGFVVPQEVQQITSLAAGCSQVDVGDPDGPVSVHPGGGDSARIQDMSLVVMMSRIGSRQYDKDIAIVGETPTIVMPAVDQKLTA